MPRPTKIELVDEIYKNALAALVFAVAEQKMPREPYSGPIKDAAWNLVKAYQSGHLHTRI